MRYRPGAVGCSVLGSLRMLAGMVGLVGWAREVARDLMAEKLPRRSAHLQSVGGKTELRGLAEFMREFPDDRSAVRDAVWYCDMTTSPVGVPVTFDERLAEIRERYGPDHTVPRGITAASEEIRQAVRNVETLASRAGVRLH